MKALLAKLARNRARALQRPGVDAATASPLLLPLPTWERWWGSCCSWDMAAGWALLGVLSLEGGFVGACVTMGIPSCVRTL